MLMVILSVIRQVSWKDGMCTSADVNGCYNGQNQEHNKYNTAVDNGLATARDIENVSQLRKLQKNGIF